MLVSCMWYRSAKQDCQPSENDQNGIISGQIWTINQTNANGHNNRHPDFNIVVGLINELLAVCDHTKRLNRTSGIVHTLAQECIWMWDISLSWEFVKRFRENWGTTSPCSVFGRHFSESPILLILNISTASLLIILTEYVIA